jgi:hypothetical protein
MVLLLLAAAVTRAGDTVGTAASSASVAAHSGMVLGAAYSSHYRGSSPPTSAFNNVGFRWAADPREPSSVGAGEDLQ